MFTCYAHHLCKLSILNSGTCATRACMYGVTFFAWYTCRKSFSHALASDAKLSISPLARDCDRRVELTLRNCLQISWITSTIVRLGNRIDYQVDTIEKPVLFRAIQIPPLQLLGLLTLVKMKWDVVLCILCHVKGFVSI